MPQTPNHAIVFPVTNKVPNIPLDMQTMAESVDAAITSETMRPMIICEKTGTQVTSATPGQYTDVIWQTEIHKQGITHDANSASFVITEPGIYQVTARVAFMMNANTGTCIATVNGVDKEPTRIDTVGTSAAWPKSAFTHSFKLNVNDVVKIRAASSVASSTLSAPECSFQMIKIANYS